MQKKTPIENTLEAVNDAMLAMGENKVRDVFNALKFGKSWIKRPKTDFEAQIIGHIDAAVSLLQVQRHREAKERIELAQSNLLVFVTRQQQKGGVR